MRFRFNPTRGSMEIDWREGPLGEPPLDPPCADWQDEADQFDPPEADE